tara:strand:- start:89 stop:1126 length:1038 start_codon:yes stop_codon:yes gene_type:complete
MNKLDIQLADSNYTGYNNKNTKNNEINELEILKQFNPTDPKYTLISENIEIIDNYKIIKQLFINNQTNIRVHKTIKYLLIKNRINKKKVMERKKWESFGKGLNNQGITNTSDDVFMEWNPEIFNSKKTIDWMSNYIKNRKIGKHTENIIYNNNKINVNNMPKILEDYNTLLEYEKNNSKIIEKLQPKFVPSFLLNNTKSDKGNDDELTDKKKQEIKSGITGKRYIPPSLRKNVNSSENKSISENNLNNIKYNNMENELPSLKISNLPEDITRDFIFDFIKSLNLNIKFKLICPKNRDSDKLRDYCFLNIFSKDEGNILKDEINGKKIGYNIINCDWSTPRKQKIY